MQQQDVERVLRDVLSAHGLRISMLAVERTPDGWRSQMPSAFSSPLNYRMVLRRSFVPR
jgi:hypothetical protein